MTISTKDFTAIATALHSTRPTNGAGIPMSQWERDCIAIADALEALNPHFRRDLFLEACGAR